MKKLLISIIILLMLILTGFTIVKGIDIGPLKVLGILEIKDENDNPSIGIILCQNKSNKIVDYTLKYINKPVGVSEYKIFDQLSKEIQSKLPSEKEVNIFIDIEE